jgi:hypothetical protein
MTRQHDFWATVDGARGEQWKRTVGTNRFPIESPLPIRGNLPGLGDREVYLLALDQLDAATRGAIMVELARSFGIPAAEIAEEISRVGVPILAEDCSVTVHNPQRWF